MSTINISLPEKQVNLVDKMMVAYGFANRSEFIRAVLRFLFLKPEVLEEAALFPFISPKEKSRKKIIAGFKKSGKYSSAFLKDLKEGLAESDYFTP